MGAWGAGLYSNDFAADLKAMIAAVARLPHASDELVGILERESEGAAADPSNEDHTAFWLIVADRFGRLGIDSPRARHMALAIINKGVDLARMAELGMTPADLKKRRAMLEALRPVIEEFKPPAKPRPTLKQPQPFLMTTGEMYVYPTCKGHCTNPYLSPRNGDPAWRQDGWGAALVAEHGRAFGFLSWYRLCSVDKSFPEPPDMATIMRSRFSLGMDPGTCSLPHFQRMALNMVGAVTIDEAALRRMLADAKKSLPAARYAIADISVSNNLMYSRQTWFQGPLVSEIIAR